MIVIEKINKKIKFWEKWLSHDTFFIKQSIKTRKCKKRIVLMDTADHDNLGDHAIAMAEWVFVKNYLPEYGVIEIPGGNILRHTLLYKALIRKTDVLTIAGGGFLGTLWPYEEKIVQCILNNFQRNKVIIFPQTFFVEEDQDFAESHPGYLKHPNLTICLRDEASYSKFCSLMPKLQKSLMYMPDMVCGLSPNIRHDVRQGVGLCFREDKECVLSRQEQEEIMDVLKEMNGSIDRFTMINAEFIVPESRVKSVIAKLEIIASKKLVITDRLHAMLFSAITATPCIAMNNKSGKVQGGYQWIEHLPYIRFVQRADQIPEALRSLDLEKVYQYDKNFVEDYWERLAKLINGD